LIAFAVILRQSRSRI